MQKRAYIRLCYEALGVFGASVLLCLGLANTMRNGEDLTEQAYVYVFFAMVSLFMTTVAVILRLLARPFYQGSSWVIFMAGLSLTFTGLAPEFFILSAVGLIPGQFIWQLEGVAVIVGVCLACLALAATYVPSGQRQSKH